MRNFEKLIKNGQKIADKGGRMTELSLSEIKHVICNSEGMVMTCINMYNIGLAIGARVQKEKIDRE